MSLNLQTLCQCSDTLREVVLLEQQVIDHAVQICKLINENVVNSVNWFSCTCRKLLKLLGEIALAVQRLAGSRIREKRLDLGLRQAAVAEAVGISPSYLNLIEHNRRRIGGKLLADIARALAVEPARLLDGADADMLEQMHSAASKLAAAVVAEVELGRAEELAARYPGWAGLIVAQAARISSLQQQVQALTDRMSSDPHLAGSLHDVISAVSAIRSAASILVGPEDLDADWQRRFHQNIHDDSLRLAASSEALVSFLDAPEAEIELATPIEQVERSLAKTGFHVAALEGGEVDLEEVAQAADLANAARDVFMRFAAQYRDDALRLPLGTFTQACAALEYDPIALAAEFDAPFDAVLRRLAGLTKTGGHPPFGLAVCDAAGGMSLLKTVPGFAIPRAGGGCPLWPIYTALSRPAQPIRAKVTLPGANATPLLCYAIAQPQSAQQFDVPPALQSTMLVVPDPGDTGGSEVFVGVSCRICPRTDCASRREPALAGVADETAL